MAVSPAGLAFNSDFRVLLANSYFNTRYSGVLPQTSRPPRGGAAAAFGFSDGPIPNAPLASEGAVRGAYVALANRTPPTSLELVSLDDLSYRFPIDSPLDIVKPFLPAERLAEVLPEDLLPSSTH